MLLIVVFTVIVNLQTTQTICTCAKRFLRKKKCFVLILLYKLNKMQYVKAATCAKKGDIAINCLSLLLQPFPPYEERLSGLQFDHTYNITIRAVRPSRTYPFAESPPSYTLVDIPPCLEAYSNLTICGEYLLTAKTTLAPVTRNARQTFRNAFLRPLREPCVLSSSPSASRRCECFWCL